ncbi:hypothetical protein L195_g063666, partial [Trifolium pratense]
MTEGLTLSMVAHPPTFE